MHPSIPNILLITFLAAALTLFQFYRKGGKIVQQSGTSHQPKGRWLLYSGMMLLGVSMGIITGISIAVVFDLMNRVILLIISGILFFTAICAVVCHRIEKRDR